MSMITGLAIENFKGIRERVEIELRPLTLLFGANSAGKSSILHALLYAQEVFSRHHLDVGRTVSGGASVDLGGFKNLLHNHDLANEVRFQFAIEFDEDLPGSWDPDDEYDDPEYTHLSFRLATAQVSVAIRWSELEQKPFVREYVVSLNDRPFGRIVCDAPRKNIRIVDLDAEHPMFFDFAAVRKKLSLHAPSEDDPTGAREFHAFLGTREEDPAFFATLLEATRRWLLPVGEPGAIGILEEEDALPSSIREDRYRNLLIATKVGEDEEDLGEDEVTFYKLRPKLSYLTRILHNLLIGPGLAVRYCLESFRTLGPIREVPQRDYQPPKSPDPARWACGLGAWDRLATADDEFLAAVSDWVQLLTGRAFDEAEAGAKLDLNMVPTQSRLLIVPTDESIELRPADVGIGISQVVPVIVTALDGEGRLVAIEQPELHIHPRLQAEIADLFLQAVKKTRNRFLIETHSEHFILRLQRRIRETSKGQLQEGMMLTSEGIAVYYVSQSEGSTRVCKIDIDKNGEFIQPWPDDFFEIDFYERFA